MLALQFATVTANLASQNAFLFLATHGPIFIAPSALKFIGKALQAGPNTRFALVGSKLN